MGSLQEFLFIFLTVLVVQGQSAQTSGKPNIIFIYADDLGWNDVGYTGNSELQTPNIDALAYNGRILKRYYTNPICTPSRSALFTSRYSSRTGMQGLPIVADEPRALPISERLMPQYFKDMGYSTHLVGKWHLGYYDWKYTPTLRGAFDSFFGYLNGVIGYYDHSMVYGNKTGHDWWRNLEQQHQLQGQYATDLITEESLRIIKNAKKKEPLYLFISHLAVHAGNPGNDLEYPPNDLARFSYIPDLRRRKLAAMAWNLDKSVGSVIQALKEENMLDNSIIVFASDNGAQTRSFIYQNDGSNYPFRGQKISIFEGGVHTTGIIWSKNLQGKGISEQLFSVTDWFPTLYAAAGGDWKELSGIDGRNQWPALLKVPTGNENKDKYATRDELLVYMNDVSGQMSVVSRNWKLLSGTIFGGAMDGWTGNYTNENYNYDPSQVVNSPANMALSSLISSGISTNIMLNTRQQAMVNCSYEVTPVSCNPVIFPCLFDLDTDPCEQVNLQMTNPDIVMELLAKLESYASQMKPQMNAPSDPLAYSKKFGNDWMPWYGSKSFNICKKY